MSIALSEHPDGVETEPGNRIVYDLARNEAHFGAARVDGEALVWELPAVPARANGSCAATASTSRRAASRTGTFTRDLASDGCSSAS